MHSLALTAEGRVVAWGSNDVGQTNVPSGLSNVVAIAAGDHHSLALTAEGTRGGVGRQRLRPDERAQRVEQRGGDCGGIWSQSGADGRGPGGGVGRELGTARRTCPAG